MDGDNPKPVARGDSGPAGPPPAISPPAAHERNNASDRGAANAAIKGPPPVPIAPANKQQAKDKNRKRKHKRKKHKKSKSKRKMPPLVATHDENSLGDESPSDSSTESDEAIGAAPSLGGPHPNHEAGGARNEPVYAGPPAPEPKGPVRPNGKGQRRSKDKNGNNEPNRDKNAEQDSPSDSRRFTFPNSTPLPGVLSKSLRIVSSASMKYHGDVISP